MERGKGKTKTLPKYKCENELARKRAKGGEQPTPAGRMAIRLAALFPALFLRVANVEWGEMEMARAVYSLFHSIHFFPSFSPLPRPKKDHPRGQKGRLALCF